MKVNEAAPVLAAAQRGISASPELVWSVLTDLEHWVDWNPDVTEMQVGGPVSPGTEFRWKAGGATIISTIQEMEEKRRIVWTGRTLGIRAVHAWTLEADGTGVAVRTEESFEGMVARVLARPLRKMLHKSLTAGLDALAAECETRSGL